MQGFALKRDRFKRFARNKRVTVLKLIQFILSSIRATCNPPNTLTLTCSLQKPKTGWNFEVSVRYTKRSRQNSETACTNAVLTRIWINRKSDVVLNNNNKNIRTQSVKRLDGFEHFATFNTGILMSTKTQTTKQVAVKLRAQGLNAY